MEGVPLENLEINSNSASSLPLLVLSTQNHKAEVAGNKRSPGKRRCSFTPASDGFSSSNKRDAEKALPGHQDGMFDERVGHRD